MEIKKIKRQIVSKLDMQSDQYEVNSKEMIKKLKDIDELYDEAELGGGEHHHERLAKKGKMSIRERIFNVLDPDTPFLEISPLLLLTLTTPLGEVALQGLASSVVLNVLSSEMTQQCLPGHSRIMHQRNGVVALRLQETMASLISVLWSRQVQI